MFFIYSIELETLKVKLYDFCKTKDAAKDLLRTCATNFVRVEHGDRRAAVAFKDMLLDEEVTEDGYFLRNSSTETDQINVYVRKTRMYNGWTGTFANVDVHQTMIFGLTEAAMGMPIEATGRGVTRPTFANEAQSVAHSSLLSELTLAISKRRRIYEYDLKVD